MWVDRPDPADESGDVGPTGNARPSDEPDATGKGLEREAGSEGRPGSAPALPDAVLRSVRSLAYRTRVEAAYRQCWFDGLNAFFVAVEHEARLGPSFRTPPNFFDAFVLAGTARSACHWRGSGSCWPNRSYFVRSVDRSLTQMDSISLLFA